MAGDERTGFFIARSLYSQLLVFARGTENQFGEPRCRELPFPGRFIGETQPAYLDGISGAVLADRNEYRQFLRDRVAGVLEYRVALPVTRAISILFANRQGSRRPEAARLFVPNIDRLGLRIAAAATGVGGGRTAGSGADT